MKHADKTNYYMKATFFTLGGKYGTLNGMSAGKYTGNENFM